MSTDLYGIRVLQIDPEAFRMRLRVFVVYYDTEYEYHQPIPEDRSFFVRVLCDKDGLGDDISAADRFNEAYVDANAFRFVDRFVELERRNAPLQSYDSYSDFYYERDGKWENEEYLVQADFDLYVTDRRYLEPFEILESWGTTAYPTTSDQLRASEYLEIPDFLHTHTFSPFEDAELEASTVDSMSFSADNGLLAIANNESDLRVFDTKTWTATAEVENAGGMFFQPGWTQDGRIAGISEDNQNFIAIDLKTLQKEPFAPFGWSARPGGKRFLNGHNDDKVVIYNQQGETLFEIPRPPGYMSWASFDSSGDLCALAIEGQVLHLVDLASGEVKEFDYSGVCAVALSPDGKFIVSALTKQFVVLRANTGEVIRTMKVQGYPTAVAWSPDGNYVATSYTDQMGYNSKVLIHPVGRVIVEEEARPLTAPALQEMDFTALVKLYVERTSNFAPGWRSHLDDDLFDFHLALVRMGLDFDLVPRIKAIHGRRPYFRCEYRCKKHRTSPRKPCSIGPRGANPMAQSSGTMGGGLCSDYEHQKDTASPSLRGARRLRMQPG